MIAAYNGGPGNLAKWQRVTDHGDDPLLFVESIPSRETRNFVQKVLASYWIYSARLGQDVPSLDAIADGEWPAYRPPSGKTAAKNARH
jgi:soluble lytic murein transglycosylase-like protein